MDSNDSEVFQSRRTVKKTLMDSLNEEVLQWTGLSMLSNKSCQSRASSQFVDWKWVVKEWYKTVDGCDK